MANEISIVVRTTDAASRGFGAIGQAAVGMNAAIDAAGSALDSIDAIQQSGTQKAIRLARAQIDVEQAMVDGEQAVTDLTQAQLDLNQSEIDGAQAGVDLEQSKVDAKQADLDATVAIREYNEAVKEHGRNSEEARQAGIDLAQAQTDLTQANLDAKQATADAAQAQSDGKQAVTDMSQATIDAKSAQLDLNEAQAAVDPTPVQQAAQKFQELAPALGLAALAGQSMASAMNLTRVRTLAATAATKAYAVAQRILNIVMRLNPIGLVITAIALLVGGLILAYKRSETFRAVVQAAFKAVKIAAQIMWQGLRIAFSAVSGALADAGRKFRLFWTVSREALSRLVSFARSVPGRIRGAFGGLYAIITNPVRNAVNAVKSWLGGLLDFARSIPGRIASSVGKAINPFAHGGVTGSADGGSRSGLTMTGEAGPEILQLPPGTRVRSNPDTRRMMSTGGGMRDATITLIIKGTDILEGLREVVRVKGGNVQTVIGK